MILLIIGSLLVLSVLAFYLGERRTEMAVEKGLLSKSDSLPLFSGIYLGFYALVPPLILLALWLMLEPIILDSLMLQTISQLSVEPQEPAHITLFKLKHLSEAHFPSDYFGPGLNSLAERYQMLHAQAELLRGATLLSALLVGCGWAWQKLSKGFNSRLLVEGIFQRVLWCCACLAILTTVGIVFSVLFESLRFFNEVGVGEFLFGTHWSPQTAIRSDQVGAMGSFGALPLFWGTFFISLIAMMIAAPTGLMVAIYLAEYAKPGLRDWVKPALEILAGIPTVVYGYFAALTVAPMIRDLGESIGMSVSSESALAAGLVMGIMIIPLVSSLTDDVIKSVPQAMREGALAMGATQSECIKQVVLPAALPGIIGSLVLALSRAIGETMIVVMAAGLAAKLTANPLDSVTTVTVQIVTLLVGDQEFDSPKTLVAFALGLVLITATLSLNYIAMRIVRTYHAKYE